MKGAPKALYLSLSLHWPLTHTYVLWFYKSQTNKHAYNKNKERNHICVNNPLSSDAFTHGKRLIMSPIISWKQKPLIKYSEKGKNNTRKKN